MPESTATGRWWWYIRGRERFLVGKEAQEILIEKEDRETSTRHEQAGILGDSTIPVQK